MTLSAHRDDLVAESALIVAHNQELGDSAGFYQSLVTRSFFRASASREFSLL
jgi:hypothetical protein